MECRDVRALADSYLDDELLVETNHALLAHVGHCPACHADLKKRQALRATLKRAFKADPRLAPTADFTTSLTNRFRPRVAHASSTLSLRQLAWISSVAVVIAVAVWAVQWARDPRRSPGISHATQIPVAVLRLTESAAGDHRDCALRQQLPEPPIAFEQAASFDRALRGLDHAVRVRARSLPVPLEPIAAHVCRWKAQRFGHLVFSYKGEVLSLLVTSPGGDVAGFASSAPAECPGTAGFSIACFAAPRHALFVVSDLPSRETLTLAEALAPSLRDHLAKDIAIGRRPVNDARKFYAESIMAVMKRTRVQVKKYE